MNNAERIKDLERRVKELEDAAKKNTPWDWDKPYAPWPKPSDFPDYEPNKWPNNDPWIPKNDDGVKCPSCGVVFRGFMGYCCPNKNCPMGAGPITC